VSLLLGMPEYALIRFKDLVGIVPNVIIVSLCTTAVAIESLRAAHREETHQIATRALDPTN
jgi:hypothetical protein